MDFFENNTAENNLKIPYSIEAEEALLGSIFIKPDIISDVLEKIGIDDFYKNNHKIIFSEMLKLYNEGKIIDTLVVINSLKQKDFINEIGGEDIVYDLINVVPTAANAINYAEIIKECSIRRALIDTGEKITRMSYRGYEQVETMLDKAESMIFKIAESKQKKDVISLGEMATQKLKSLDEMSKFKGG